MMKSFFKKLAVVMALAMVVSLAAPAGSALAAGLVITEQTAAKADAKAEYNVAVDGTLDLKFYGAQAGWQKLYQWTSLNPEIASVDEAGLVKGLKDGEATIKLTIGEQVAEVKVIVGAGKEVATAYTVQQVNHNTVKFVFNKDVTFKAEDVTLTKMYGDYPINWPVSFFECKDKTVTISTYVDFEDGDQFIVKIGAEDEGTKFTATIGAVDEIKISWKSTGLSKEEAGMAYAPLSEDDDEIPVYLSAELFSNGVNVSKAKKYKDGEISYALAVENGKVDIDEDVLFFEDYTAAYAVVVPSFTYEVDGEDKTFKGTEVVIGATPVPAYGIDSFVAWTIVKAGDTKIDWNSPLQSFPAFDDASKDHTLAVLVKDNLGKYYVFPSEAVDGMAADKYKYNNNEVLLFEDIADTDDEAEDYRLEFKSTNDNTLFVGNDDGSITTIGKYNTSVLVSLYNTNDDDEEYLVRHLTALTVKVKEARKIADLKITACGELPSDGDFTTGDVTFKVVDQYGDAINANDLIIKTNVDKEGFTLKQLYASKTGKTGEFKLTVDGSQFTYTKKDKDVVLSSAKYTVQVKDTNVKGDFTVKVSEPKYNADGTIKVEELKVAASNVNQTIANSGKLGDLKKTITVNEYSNDLKVGVKDTNITLLTKGSALLKDGKFDLNVTSAQANVGDVFVVVYGPNGEAVDGSMISGTNGSYTFTAGGTTEKTLAVSGTAIDVMSYKATGDYTVKVFTVDREYESKVSKCDVVVTKFNVSRNNPAVTFDKQEVVDLTAEGAIDLDTLVKKAFNFKFNNDALKESEAYFVITDADYKYNEASGRVFVYSVQVYAPLNNGDDDTFFDAGKVTINKYVEVDSLAK